MNRTDSKSLTSSPRPTCPARGPGWACDRAPSRHGWCHAHYYQRFKSTDRGLKPIAKRKGQRMTVRVLKKRPPPELRHQGICPKCGATLEWLPGDVEPPPIIAAWLAPHLVGTINCPNCSITIGVSA